MPKASRPSTLRCGHEQRLTTKQYHAFFDPEGVAVWCLTCRTEQKVSSVPADDKLQASFNDLLGF